MLSCVSCLPSKFLQRLFRIEVHGIRKALRIFCSFSLHCCTRCLHQEVVKLPRVVSSTTSLTYLSESEVDYLRPVLLNLFDLKTCCDLRRFEVFVTINVMMAISVYAAVYNIYLFNDADSSI